MEPKISISRQSLQPVALTILLGTPLFLSWTVQPAPKACRNISPSVEQEPYLVGSKITDQMVRFSFHLDNEVRTVGITAATTLHYVTRLVRRTPD